MDKKCGIIIKIKIKKKESYNINISPDLSQGGIIIYRVLYENRFFFQIVQCFTNAIHTTACVGHTLFLIMIELLIIGVNTNVKLMQQHINIQEQ